MPRRRATRVARPYRRRAPVRRRAPARRAYRRRVPSSYYPSLARVGANALLAGGGHVVGSALGKGLINNYPSYLESAYGYAKPLLGYGLKGASYLMPGVASTAVGALGQSLIEGKGAYSLNRNSLMTGDQVPFMHSSKDGVRIRHREFIADVSSSVNFVNNSYSVNPGLSDTFPWLSAIAENFEEYRFEGLVFEFVSTSADALNSTNTALGTVIMAAEYNVAQPAYINKQQMENSMWASSTKPSCSMISPIECSPALNPLANQYVRIGAVASGQDPRLYDLCNMQVATVGSQAVAVIGELWASYDVVLLKPQLSSGLNLAGQSAHYQLTGATATIPLGSSVTSKFDSIGLSFNSPTGTVITMPVGCQGNYQFTYFVDGSAAGLTNPGFTYSSNATGLKIWEGDTTSMLSNNSSTASAFFYVSTFALADPTQNTTITVGTSGALPASVSSADILLNQINGNLNS